MQAPPYQTAPPAARTEVPVLRDDRPDRVAPPHPVQQPPKAATPPQAEPRRLQAEFQPRSQMAEPKGRQGPQKTDRGQRQGEDDERGKGNGKEHKR